MKNACSRAFTALLIVILSCLFAQQLKAQSPQLKKEVGTAASMLFSSGSTPKIQLWYNPSDLQPAPSNGIIAKIWLRNSTANQSAAVSNFTIKLKQPTSGTQFSDATFQTEMKTVFSRAAYTLAGSSVANGWFGIPLDTVFNYDASLPLVCEIAYFNITGSLTTLVSDAGLQATVGIKKIQSTVWNGTAGVAANDTWQDFGLDFLPPCTTPPVAGNAVLSRSRPLCADSLVNLLLKDVSQGDGQLYQWQYSSSPAGPFSDTGGQHNYHVLTINPLTNLWYRCKVTCGSQSSFSAPVFAGVTPRFPSGTYTIDGTIPSGSGNFQTFTEAVNAIYCGTNGPVVFNVAAGQVFNEIIPPFANTDSLSGSVVFQKFGTGGNPVIVRSDTGMYNANGLGALGDAIIILNGTDNITFNGIDVTAASEGIEYGYLIRKNNSFDGCKNVTISNCRITMNRGTKDNVVGIFTSQMDRDGIIKTIGSVTVTSVSGRHENITITGNTIKNVSYGIVCIGPFYIPNSDLYDRNFAIGNELHGNTIQDFFSSASTGTDGIQVRNINQVSIVNNNIINQAQPLYHTSGLNGISLTDGYQLTARISNNRINLLTAAVIGNIRGIYTAHLQGSATIDSNTIVVNNASCYGTSFIYVANGITPSISYNKFTNSKFNSFSNDCHLIYFGGAGSSAIIQKNVADSIVNSSALQLYGYYNASDQPGAEYFLDNVFTQIESSSFSGYYSSNRRDKIIRGNIIADIKAKNLTGIEALMGAKTISHNKIHHLISDSVYVQSFQGIKAKAGSDTSRSDSIYNNTIGGFSNFSQNSFLNFTGIDASEYSSLSPSKSLITNNTVYLNAKVISSGSANALIIRGSSPQSMFAINNNILVNNSLSRSNSLITTIRYFTGIPGRAVFNSNNNIFFLEHLGGVHVIQSLHVNNATVTDTTLAGVINTSNGNELSSLNEMPHFLSLNGIDSNYLHIDPAIPTQIEGGAIPIPGVSDDIDRTLRNPLIPDVGADETNGTATDITPPGIYHRMLPSICTNGQTIVAQIADARGIDTSNGLKPRIYYKKTTESNVLAASNTSAANGWKWVTPANSSSPFSFFINPALLASPLVAGDTIMYFIIAQDKFTTPQVAVSGAKLTLPATTVILSAAHFPVTEVKNSYAIMPVPSPYTIAANRAEVCIASNAVKLLLNSGVFSGNEFQWQSAPVGGTNWTNVAGANTDSLILPAVTNSIQYRLVATCNNVPIPSSPSNAIPITVYNPSLVSVTPGSRCGSGTVALSAGSAGQRIITWYNAPAAVTPLDTGVNFTTPVINTNTTYYAAAAEKGITVFGGLASPVSTSSLNNASYGMAFTITQPVIINSVNVHSAGGTAISIELYNSTGTVLLQTTGTRTVPANAVSTIDLGWHLYPGTYRIKTGTMNGAFRRDNSITFPVALNTFGTINGYIFTATGSVGTSIYSWFYNWSLTALCVGEKTAVLARTDVCCTTNQWIGGASNAWENAANWSCGVVPGGTHNVIIPAGATVVINSNVTVNTMVVNQGANVTVSPGFVLTVLH
jgi:hypothetical protein